jgi:hypothetical protein
VSAKASASATETVSAKASKQTAKKSKAEMPKDFAPASYRPCDISNIDFIQVNIANLLKNLKEAGAAPLAVTATVDGIFLSLSKLLPHLNDFVDKLLNEQTLDMAADAARRYVVMRVAREILVGEYSLQKDAPGNEQYKQLLKRLLDSIDWDFLQKQKEAGISSPEVEAAVDLATAVAEKNEKVPPADRLPLSSSAAALADAAKGIVGETSPQQAQKTPLTGGTRRRRLRSRVTTKLRTRLKRRRRSRRRTRSKKL